MDRWFHHWGIAAKKQNPLPRAQCKRQLALRCNWCSTVANSTHNLISRHILQELLFTESLTIRNLTVSSMLLVSCDNHHSHHSTPSKTHTGLQGFRVLVSDYTAVPASSNACENGPITHNHMNTELYNRFSHQTLGNFLTEFHSLLVNQQHTPCCTPIQLESASLHSLRHSTEDTKTTQVRTLATEDSNHYLIGRCLCYEFFF
jgi:hypothetical protein